MSHEFRAKNYEPRISSHELRATNFEPRIEIDNKNGDGQCRGSLVLPGLRKPRVMSHKIALRFCGLFILVGDIVFFQ